MTRKGKWTQALVDLGQARRARSRQIRTSRSLRCDTEPHKAKPLNAQAAKKSFYQVRMVPVPQTDTGGQVENTKASEKTLVKELGKMVP